MVLETERKRWRADNIGINAHFASDVQRVQEMVMEMGRLVVMDVDRSFVFKLRVFHY